MKPGNEGNEAPRRRKRYPGTHPRRFEHRYKELDPGKFPGIHEHVRGRGMTPAGTHVPILVAEVMDLLRPSPGESVLDCTLGFGGHAVEFARRISPGGLLVGIDADAEEMERARSRIAGTGVRASLRNRNFESLSSLPAEEGIQGFDVIFADLGLSSMQIDDPGRGFSYKFDGPLDMRMDRRQKRTAADLLATMGEEEFAEALSDLADEEDAPEIARLVVGERRKGPIARTSQLAGIVMRAKGTSKAGLRRAALEGEARGPHPAAKTFQALRMLVNREQDALRRMLKSAPTCLLPGGRIGVICFHSGEDRLVKAAFREGLDEGLYSAVAAEVVRPCAAETRSNPRSSAAKLRWALRAG